MLHLKFMLCGLHHILVKHLGPCTDVCMFFFNKAMLMPPALFTSGAVRRFEPRRLLPKLGHWALARPRRLRVCPASAHASPAPCPRVVLALTTGSLPPAAQMREESLGHGGPLLEHLASCSQ
jgi:hypothetical protein